MRSTSRAIARCEPSSSGLDIPHAGGAQPRAIASERASPPVERQNSPNVLVRRPWTIPPGGEARFARGHNFVRGSSYCPRAAVRRHEELGHSTSYFLGIAPPILWSSAGAALTGFTPGPRARRYRAHVVIGFVGAGLMGSGMVRNLAAAGHQVRLFTRTPSRAEGLPATVVPSIAEAVAGADLACSCVTDSPDVIEVVTAMLAAPSPAPIVVEMSTIAPAVARELAERCAARGVAYLDCPVSGGPAGAADGTLAIMCGGDAAALSTAAPALDAMGDPGKRLHCGPVGLGLVAKLVNNMLVASITVATAEALGAGQRAGLDPALAREVVMRSSGDSWQLRNLFPRVLAGDHTPGFTVRNLLKDLGHAADLSAEPLDMMALARERLARMPPDADYGVVARLTMDLPQ